MQQNPYVQIRILREITTGSQFTSDFLLLYGLGGAATVTVGVQEYILENGGVLAVNEFSQISINCGIGGSLLYLSVSNEMASLSGFSSKNGLIHCYVRDNSSGSQNEFRQVRAYLARVFEAYYQQNRHNTPYFTNCVLKLLEVLQEGFLSEEQGKGKPGQQKEKYEKLLPVIKYIYSHWNEDISIKQIAEQFFVSSSHLSRLFRECTGKTLTQYLTEIRLEKAEIELLSTDHAITDVGYNNGFSNVSAFISYFRRKNGVTPKQFRLRKNLQMEEASPPESPETGELLNRGVEELLSFAGHEQMEEPSNPVINREIRISAAREGKRFRSNWKRLLNIGYAKDGLLENVQRQIRTAQEEVGFEYIRFHGILDDDMYVYHEDPEGNVSLDFSRVDLLFSFLVRQGFKLYLEFSFMPQKLAEKPVRIWDRPSCFSLFKDRKKWEFLVTSLLKHCISRYGFETVRSWRFTMIGSNLVMPGWLSQEEYQQLYQATFQAVKSVHPDLCVGGPGGFSSSIWSGSQFRTFFEFTVREGCVPDFVSFQCQPHEFVERDKAFLEFTLTHHSSPAVLSADEHYLRSTISQMKKLLEAFHLEDREIWIEEWNSTLWQRDLSNDLCYKAAWLTKNIRENTDDAEAFGYWMLTDYSEERSALKSIFHGGYGLFTYTGIPKSGWYAMKLLNMLGENLIDRGDGWIFTGGRSGFQLLLDHYAHYDDLFRYRYQIIADPSKAYDVFITKGRIFYEINISGLEKGTYVIRRIHISRKHGSSFDAWLSMGRPPYLSEEEQTYLTHISAPHYHTGTAEVEETLHLECILNQHEVEMIIIEKADLKNNEII